MKLYTLYYCDAYGNPQSITVLACDLLDACRKAALNYEEVYNYDFTDPEEDEYVS